MVSVLVLCVAAAGEEIGWRGFLWPLVRRRLTFLPATLVVTGVWWLYHLPLILLGWYASVVPSAFFIRSSLGQAVE